MRFPGLTIALLCTICFGCKTDQQKQNQNNMDSYSYELGVVGGFSELINAGVKKLALSAPLAPAEMDRFMHDAEKVAARHNVPVYRESELLVTDLFPADVASGKGCASAL